MAKPEQVLQIQVARYLEVTLRPPTWWSAVGHGGGGLIRGALLKRMGVKKGVPDLLVIHPVASAGSELGCWLVGIELKAPKGRQSPEQVAVQRAFEQAGGFYAVARSVDEVEDILRGVGVPLYSMVRRAA